MPRAGADTAVECPDLMRGREKTPPSCSPVDQVLSELLDERVDIACSGFPVNLEFVDNPLNEPLVIINPVAKRFYEAHSGVVYRKNLQ